MECVASIVYLIFSERSYHVITGIGTTFLSFVARRLNSLKYRGCIKYVFGFFGALEDKNNEGRASYQVGPVSFASSPHWSFKSQYLQFLGVSAITSSYFYRWSKGT